jgi:hydrogenase maturation protease
VNATATACRSVAVLGIGNILQGDDGVGVRTIESLEEEGGLPGVLLVDGGTSPIDMLGVFQESDVVIVVDCVSGGMRPGSICRLPGDELDKVLDGERFAHGIGVAETVRLAHSLGHCAEVVVFGVEPARLGWSLELSEEVSAALPKLSHQVRVEAQQALHG